MRITKVRYGYQSRLKNSDFQNLELEAYLEEGEDWKAALAELQKEIRSYSSLQDQIDKQEGILHHNQQKYYRIKDGIHKLRIKWEEAKEICKAAGIEIKGDFPQEPLIPKEEEDEFLRQIELEGLF